jgi:hypothetical protein
MSCSMKSKKAKTKQLRLITHAVFADEQGGRRGNTARTKAKQKNLHENLRQTFQVFQASVVFLSCELT